MTMPDKVCPKCGSTVAIEPLANGAIRCGACGCFSEETLTAKVSVRDKREPAAVQCPQCQSSLLISVGTQKHCNDCALDFDVERNAIALAAARRKSEGFHGWKRENN